MATKYTFAQIEDRYFIIEWNAAGVVCEYSFYTKEEALQFAAANGIAEAEVLW